MGTWHGSRSEQAVESVNTERQQLKEVRIGPKVINHRITIGLRPMKEAICTLKAQFLISPESKA